MLLVSFSVSTPNQEPSRPQPCGSQSGCCTHSNRLCRAVTPAFHFLSLPRIPSTRLPLYLLLIIWTLTLFSPLGLSAFACCWHFLAFLWWLYLKAVGILPASADPCFCQLLFQSVLNTGAPRLLSSLISQILTHLGLR